MSFLDEITVLILAYNEEANIERTLEGAQWAKRIVVIDSGSTDKTSDIVRSYSQAELRMRPFDNHQAQWNFGLDVCGRTSQWILALDADYFLDSVFQNELAELRPPDDVSGYNALFRYCIFGRALHGNLYPSVTVLYRHSRARYVQSGHTQRLVLRGAIGTLKARIYHDDRKPLSRWLASQQKYAELEADHLVAASRAELRRNDRIRLMGWPAPLLIFFYTLIGQRCFLDGWAGWLYVLQRTLAETMIAMEVVDRRLRSSQPE